MVRSFSYCLVLILVGCGSGGMQGGAGGLSGGGQSGTGPGGRGGSITIPSPGGTFGGPQAGMGGPMGGTGGPVGGTGGPVGDPCLLTPLPTNCGGGLCGNGVRDTCLIRSAFDACPEVRFTEVCDGADSGGQTCEALGYGGGTLACSNFCQTVDVRGCTECGSLDNWLRSCGDAPLTATVSQTSIAATDAEVALAWLQVDSNNNPTLGFARLTPNLGVISSAFIADAWVATAWGVRVAPLPSGWVVTSYAQPDVIVQHFDAAGQPVRRTTIDTIPNDTLNFEPMVASRPNGGPLVMWGSDGVLRAAVIAADGGSSTTPIDVATEDFYGGYVSAAYVGDAFFVSHSIQSAPDDVRLRLTRVGVDGRVTAAFDALPGAGVNDALLVTGADDLRVVYRGQLGSSTPDMEIWSMLWQRIDPAGSAATAPIALSWPDLSGWGVGIGFGRDTVVLLRTDYNSPWMSLVRVANDGTVVLPLRKIAIGGGQAGSWNHEIVRRGSDVIVSWISDPNRLRLARVTM